MIRDMTLSDDPLRRNQVYKFIFLILGATSGLLTNFFYIWPLGIGYGLLVGTTGIVGIVFGATMLLGFSLGRVTSNPKAAYFGVFSWLACFVSFMIAIRFDSFGLGNSSGSCCSTVGLFIPGIAGAFILAIGFSYTITSVTALETIVLTLLGGLATLGFAVNLPGSSMVSVVALGNGGGIPFWFFITWQAVMGGAFGWILDHRSKNGTVAPRMREATAGEQR